MIDDTDARILSILRDDARIPAAEVARQIGMAPSAVFERMRRLEERGVVRGYAPLIEPHAVGYGLLAFVAVTSREGPGCAEVGKALSQIPGVQEVNHIAGADDYLVKIRAADTESLGRILRERFKAIPNLRTTRTTVVLESMKETPALEVPEELLATRESARESTPRMKPAPAEAGGSPGGRIGAARDPAQRDGAPRLNAPSASTTRVRPVAAGTGSSGNGHAHKAEPPAGTSPPRARPIRPRPA